MASREKTESRVFRYQATTLVDLALWQILG